MKNNFFMLMAVICAVLIISLSGAIIFSLLGYTTVATVLFVSAGVLAALLIAAVLYSFFTKKRKGK